MEKQLLLRIKKLEQYIVDLYKKLSESGGTSTGQLSPTELDAIQGSNSPSASNPFITQNELLYDTTEVLTGALWSGQPVYRTVVPFNVPIGDPPASLIIQHELGIGVYLRTDIVAESLVPVSGEGLTSFPLAACANSVAQPAIVSTGFIATSRDQVKFEEVVNFTTTIANFFLILEYTKV